MPDIRKFKRSFNSEILCAAFWGMNLLVGTKNGLLLLDRSSDEGKVYVFCPVSLHASECHVAVCTLFHCAVRFQSLNSHDALSHAPAHPFTRPSGIHSCHVGDSQRSTFWMTWVSWCASLERGPNCACTRFSTF